MKVTLAFSLLFFKIYTYLRKKIRGLLFVLLITTFYLCLIPFDYADLSGKVVLYLIYNNLFFILCKYKSSLNIKIALNNAKITDYLMNECSRFYLKDLVFVIISKHIQVT